MALADVGGRAYPSSTSSILGMAMDALRGCCMSMQEHYVSGARVAASAGWAVTIALIAAAWVFLFLGGKAAEIGEMLALTAGVSAVGAGVMQVRVYAVKLCAEIRGNARQPTDDRVRAIH